MLGRIWAKIWMLSLGSIWEAYFAETIGLVLPCKADTNVTREGRELFLLKRLLMTVDHPAFTHDLMHYWIRRSHSSITTAGHRQIVSILTTTGQDNDPMKPADPLLTNCGAHYH
ncbi:hypothetical protein J6590_013911 [Homalodisca vitripennis]|nr:hypothetical protein J6590_013911 [Homalodisca vitripennis]